MKRHTIPVTSLRDQFLAGVIIGVVVLFILLVFQPFGTDDHEMRHKLLFLSGYGVICTVTYSLYYLLMMTIFKRWFTPQRWNMLREVLTLIPFLVIMSLAGLVYHHTVLGGYDIHINDVIYFIRISFAVAVIPFTVLLYRKWLRSKLTTVQESANGDAYFVTFESNNKGEKPVVVSSDQLLYVRSEGNYIEVVFLSPDGVKKRLLRNTLNQVESRLPAEDFIKIHRSYIVSIKQMRSLSTAGSSATVTLSDDGISVPVSRSLLKKVREFCQ